MTLSVMSVVVERVNPCIRPLLAGVVGFEPTNTRVKALRLKPLGDTPILQGLLSLSDNSF